MDPWRFHILQHQQCPEQRLHALLGQKSPVLIWEVGIGRRAPQAAEVAPHHSKTVPCLLCRPQGLAGNLPTGVVCSRLVSCSQCAAEGQMEQLDGKLVLILLAVNMWRSRFAAIKDFPVPIKTMRSRSLKLVAP